MESAAEVISIGMAVLPFAAKWGKDYISKFPVMFKYTKELGKEAVKPFIYVYGYSQTYEGFDLEKFKEAFRKNPANANVSDEELQSIAERTKYIAGKLSEAFLTRKSEDQLTQKEKDHYYLIPKNAQGKIALDEFAEYIKNTTGSAVKTQIPMLQLMFVPGAKSLGKALGMSEQELEMKTNLGDLFESVIGIAETTELTMDQQQQLDRLREANQAVQAGSSVGTVSASSIQEYTANAAAHGDQKGLKLAENVLKTNKIENITSPLKESKKVRYGDITDSTIQTLVSSASGDVPNDDSVIELPKFMVPEEKELPGDTPVDILIDPFQTPKSEPESDTESQPESKPESEPVEYCYNCGAPYNGNGDIKFCANCGAPRNSPTEGGVDENECDCMKPRFVAVIIILIIVLAVISSLPRYLITIVLVLVAAWLVWDNRDYIRESVLN